MTTKNKIAEQLKQKTGRALCDSGGYPQYDEEGNYTGSTQGYGRKYEINQNREFENEPTAFLDFSWGEIDVTLSTYHFLTEKCHLVFKPNMNYRFHEFMEDEDLWGMQAMLAYAGVDYNLEGSLKGQGYSVAGLYGDGEPMLINTYNSECLLDQTLQFVYLEINSAPHVLLQTHNGCDVRGGYSTPHLYELSEFNETSILMFADANLHLYGENDERISYWYTDDGWHWYEEGSTGGTQLRDVEIIEEDELDLEFDLSKLTPKKVRELSSLYEDKIFELDGDGYYRGGHFEASF